jgi:hypothetical protein
MLDAVSALEAHWLSLLDAKLHLYVNLHSHHCLALSTQFMLTLGKNDNETALAG